MGYLFFFKKTDETNVSPVENLLSILLSTNQE